MYLMHSEQRWMRNWPIPVSTHDNQHVSDTLCQALCIVGFADKAAKHGDSPVAIKCTLYAVTCHMQVSCCVSVAMVLLLMACCLSQPVLGMMQVISCCGCAWAS